MANMKLVARISIVLSVFCIHQTFASKEIVSILDNVQVELTPEEFRALQPLFNELQQQYDYIMQQTPDGYTTEPEYEEAFEKTWREFQESFGSLGQEHSNSVYDASLPTVTELMGTSNVTEEDAELVDIMNILQETLDESQTSINEIVKQALQLESNLLKLNKPKIVMAVLRALGVVFRASARLRQAAYCVYSHVPQLNASLHSAQAGFGCYVYATQVLLQVQVETVETVQTIKRHVIDLAAVYKKIATKKTLVGKIISVVLNVAKITRKIHDAIAVGIEASQKARNQLPKAVKNAAECGANFVQTVPQMIETATNVTTCIRFVDDTIEEYEFLKPEHERTKL